MLAIYNVTRMFIRVVSYNIPNSIMYTVMLGCVLLWFDTGRFYPYLSGLFLWHWGSYVSEVVVGGMGK